MAAMGAETDERDMAQDLEVVWQQAHDRMYGRTNELLMLPARCAH